MGISDSGVLGASGKKSANCMTTTSGSLLDLAQRLMNRCPEIFDLLTSDTQEEFETTFDKWLAQAISGLETNAVNFKNYDEEALTASLALALNRPGVHVHQEPNSNGHVDLLIEVGLDSPTWKKLAEAKIYDGPEYHFKGLHQLLGRYTTRKETRGLLVVYVKKSNISGLMKKLRNRMDETLPESQQGSCKEHSIKWSFISAHLHSCGDLLEVGHIGCNLFVQDGNAQ
jgi:hypothetical protein